MNIVLIPRVPVNGRQVEMIRVDTLLQEFGLKRVDVVYDDDTFYVQVTGVTHRFQAAGHQVIKGQ